MGYLHIDNLYKAQEILEFRNCYALEKIHGTSAHLRWADGGLGFFSGGVSYDSFVALFDQEALATKLTERFDNLYPVIIYGEAYGGKCQGMSKTYGTALKFIVFDVKVGDWWLSVPEAADLTKSLGLEFVDYALVPTDLPSLDAERDKSSVQAVRNGILEPQLREGVVLRPPFEVMATNGDRIIAKHKRAEFAERGRPKVELDPTKREVLEAADSIAAEWVTPMRLDHVINTVVSARDSKAVDMSDTPLIIKAMTEDILREASGEIVDSKEARKAIGQLTVKLFKRRIQEIPSQ